MLRKITIVQCQVGRQLTRDENLLIFKQRPDFVIFPEYYNVDPRQRDAARNAGEALQRLEYCRNLSDRFAATIIAGTAITSTAGKFYNTAFVFRKGEFVGSYRKMYPTEKEQQNGITPGKDLEYFEIDGVRFSILICADVLHHELFTSIRAGEPDIVFIPTTSPLRPDETVRDKLSRDQAIFVEGAQTSGSYLVKCCAVGNIWGGRLQGRSLVAAPWGILTRIMPDEEDRPRILSVVLDLDELRDFREKQARLCISDGHDTIH